MRMGEYITIAVTVFCLLLILFFAPQLPDKKSVPGDNLQEQNRKVVSRLMKEGYTTPEGILGFQANRLIFNLFKGNFDLAGLKKRTVLGFYVGKEPGIPSSYQVLEREKDSITSIAPFWFRLDERDPSKLEFFGPVSSQKVKQVMRFSENNDVRVYALVHNLLYGNTRKGKEVAHRALSIPEQRVNLIKNIYGILKSNGFDGVCVDIENIYTSDRENFLAFLSGLYRKLRLEGLRVIVTVPSRTSDTLTGGWGDNFDYARIGMYADKVAIMAYDEHGAYSAPGAIASENWVEDVVRYALGKLPASKILLGVPAYGFDWNLKDKSFRYLSFRMAKETAISNNVDVNWDNFAGVPNFHYKDREGDRHSVFFENARSLGVKLKLVIRYDLAGIAVWRLGMEDPAAWNIIRGYLNVKKVPDNLIVS